MDYERMAATTQRLIEKNGRRISILRLNRTPTDPSKPWRGGETPRDPEAVKVDVKGTFVEPASLARYGFYERDDELVKRVTQYVLVAGNSVGQEKNFEEFDEVVDGDIHWKITRVRMLKPADRVMLYAIGVRR